MSYRVTLTSGHRTASRSRIERLWHPGSYRVPEDMPEDVAEDAVSRKIAVKEQVAKAGAVEDGGPKSKGPAPENKLRTSSDVESPMVYKRGPGRPRSDGTVSNRRGG